MKDSVKQEDEVEVLAPEKPDPDEPLDLTGFGTMEETFGKGSNRRVVLVSRPVTLNQLVKLSR